MPYSGKNKMIKRQVCHLVPGMVLAGDVVNDEGRVLINSGALLNTYTIVQLENWNIPSVSVHLETEINVLQDPRTEKFFAQYNGSVKIVERAFNDIRKSQEVPIDALVETVDDLSENLGNGDILDRLYQLPTCDDYTYRHSVNVSLVSALIATWLKYPAEMVSAVSLTGLLHDIGKANLPLELLARANNRNLSTIDYFEYQQHVEFGHSLLQKLPDLAKSIIEGAHQHHERMDGSGYPKGLYRKSIHPYARIVAVADIYDDYLIANKDNTPVFSPYSGLEHLRTQLHLVDPKICLLFINRTTDFLSGNRVYLTDERQGRVVFVNKAFPSRSTVQLDNGQVVDLSDSQDCCISHLVAHS